MSRSAVSAAAPALALAGLLALACGGPDAPAEAPPPARARASLDRATATLGDVVTWTLEVDHEPGVSVELPQPPVVTAGLTVLEAAELAPRRRDGRVVERLLVRMRADRVGRWRVPDVRVAWRLPPPEGGAEGATGAPPPLEVGPLMVEVESLLPDEPALAELRDVKPPRPLTRLGPWAVTAVAAAAVAAMGLLLWWLVRRRPPSQPAPSPDAAALAALDRLGFPDRADAAATRRWCFAVSRLLRDYIEARFPVNASDLTSEELLAALVPAGTEGGAAVPAPQIERLRRFLALTDGVKYAARRLAAGEPTAVLEAARGFVRGTRPRAEGSGQGARPEPGGEAA